MAAPPSSSRAVHGRDPGERRQVLRLQQLRPRLLERTRRQGSEKHGANGPAKRAAGGVVHCAKEQAKRVAPAGFVTVMQRTWVTN
jgi:hypothetical protein